jgi:DNA-binding NarL/FixJ family response regulator
VSGGRPSLLITTQLLEQGSGLELITAAKQLAPDLRSLLFLQYEHRTLLEQAVKTHSDGIVLEADVGSGHVLAALRTVSKGGFYLEPRIAEQPTAAHAGATPDFRPANWR